MALWKTTLIPLLLALPSILAAPHGTPPLRSRSGPQLYSGPASSFPAMSTWVDFNTTLSAYTPTMLQAGSTSDDVSQIAAAAQSVAASQGIDARVILAMILQESSGNVNVVTTTDQDGEGTGGLMQASGCTSSADIATQIQCGTQHFAGNFQSQGGQNTVDTYYPALREYNSGSVDASDLSVATNGAGVASYVSDISQRLQGIVF